jgi:hypothetical protein
MCEDEYNNPSPIDLLIAWANSHSDYTNGEDKWGHVCHTEVIGISDLEKLRDEIYTNKKSVVVRGIKEGWWVKEE